MLLYGGGGFVLRFSSRGRVIDGFVFVRGVFEF